MYEKIIRLNNLQVHNLEDVHLSTRFLLVVVAVGVIVVAADAAGSLLLSVGDWTQKRHEAPVRVAFMPSSCLG